MAISQWVFNLRCGQTTRLLVGYPNVYMKKPEKVGPVKIFAVRRQDFSSRLLNVCVVFDESVVHPTQTAVGNFSIFSLLARLREKFNQP